jgi:CubicO group peptidase (beta-lactamase class C family)
MPELRFPVFAVLVLSGCGGNAPAPAEALLDSTTSAAVDSIVRDHMATQRIVGASLAIVRDGQVVKQAGYGLANRETGEPATPETAYFVASIAKVVGAAAILALVEDGKIGLDDSVGSSLPDLPAAWRPVTYRQLISHTSGLPSIPASPGQYVQTWAMVLAEIGQKPLTATPGTKYEYTGTNWALIDRAIAALSGQSYGDYATARVLAPVGVTSTAFGGYALVQRGRAEWYSTLKEPMTDPPEFTADPYLLRTEYPDYRISATNLFISAADLARWTDAFAAGRVIRPELVELAWTPLSVEGSRGPEGMGGWRIYSENGVSMIFSEGGARALVVHLRESKLTVSLLTNTQGAALADPLLKVIALLSAPSNKPGA